MESAPHEIENTVVHELLHVVLYKLADKASSIVHHYVRRNKVEKKLKKRLEKLEHEIIDKLTPAFTESGMINYHSKETNGEK